VIVTVTPTVELLPAGGPEGDRLAELLAPEGVPVVAVPISGSTRSTIALVEPDGTTTKINEPGPELSPFDAALAGFLHAGARGETALCTAVAYGTAAVTLEGSRMPLPKDVHPDAVRRVDVDESLNLSGAAAWTPN
jgi:fructose-1-phosphate kinase PfkB-like protein